MLVCEARHGLSYNSHESSSYSFPYLLPQVIRMLTEKAKQQEALILDLEEREKEFMEVEAEASLLRQQTESSREEMQAMGKELEQLEDRIEMMEKEKKEILKNKERLERILAEAAYSMHRILTVGFGALQKKEQGKYKIIMLVSWGGGVIGEGKGVIKRKGMSFIHGMFPALLIFIWIYPFSLKCFKLNISQNDSQKYCSIVINLSLGLS